MNVLLDAAWHSGASVPLPGSSAMLTFDFDDSIISRPQGAHRCFRYVTAGKFPFWRYLVEFEDTARQTQGVPPKPMPKTSSLS